MKKRTLTYDYLQDNMQQIADAYEKGKSDQAKKCKEECCYDHYDDGFRDGRKEGIDAVEKEHDWCVKNCRPEDAPYLEQMLKEAIRRAREKR